MAKIFKFGLSSEKEVQPTLTQSVFYLATKQKSSEILDLTHIFVTKYKPYLQYPEGEFEKDQ